MKQLLNTSFISAIKRFEILVLMNQYVHWRKRYREMEDSWMLAKDGEGCFAEASLDMWGGSASHLYLHHQQNKKPNSMKHVKTKLMTLLGLLVIGATAAYGSQTDQPKMNGKLKIVPMKPEHFSYTGKPYSKALGAYVFNYRNYDPQISRWTTPDPSGFPDGANNRVYAAVPTSQLDYEGLFTITGVTTANPKAASNADGSHKVTVEDITSVGGISSSELSNLRQAFNGWTFNVSSAALAGTLNVTQYYASATDRHNTSNPAIGLSFNYTYQDQSGAHLRWIQSVTRTSDRGTVSVIPDNLGGNQPFYPNAENSFTDLPTLLGGWTSHGTLDADTFAAIWDGKTTVTIYDGINWNGWVE